MRRLPGIDDLRDAIEAEATARGLDAGAAERVCEITEAALERELQIRREKALRYDERHPGAARGGKP